MSASQVQELVEAMARLARHNAMLTGLVSGIMSCLGMGLIALGMLGMTLHEPQIGFLGLLAGASLIGLAAYIIQR